MATPDTRWCSKSHNFKKVYESLPTVIELLTEATKGLIFKSKGEARRLIQGGGLNINKEKINSPDTPVGFVLLNNKYILSKKGKKITILSL